MAMYVIADLHLHPQNESLQRAFYAFVSKLHAGDELYILGDLFNFFVGKDQQNQAQILVKNTLAEAKALGIQTYFIRGNRDFLMSEKEAKWLNMTLLEDVALRFIGTPAYPVLLSHGDIFCTNDVEYMRYFKQVHNPCLQGIFRLLPMFIRRKIAASLREQSKNTDRSVKGAEYYGVVNATMDDYARTLSQQSDSTLSTLPLPILVHGHIHEFGQHNHLQNIQQRYALGAWGDKFSYFKLSLTPDPEPSATNIANLPDTVAETTNTDPTISIDPVDPSTLVKPTSIETSDTTSSIVSAVTQPATSETSAKVDAMVATKVATDKADSAQANSSQVASVKVDSAQVSSAYVSSAQVNSTQTASDKVAWTKVTTSKVEPSKASPSHKVDSVDPLIPDLEQLSGTNSPAEALSNLATALSSVTSLESEQNLASSLNTHSQTTIAYQPNQAAPAYSTNPAIPAAKHTNTAPSQAPTASLISTESFHDLSRSSTTQTDTPAIKDATSAVVQPKITFVEHDIDFLFRPETKL